MQQYPSSSYPAGAPTGVNPYAPPLPGAGHSVGPTPYEFGAAENDVLSSTAGWTKAAGIIQIVFGGVVPLIAGIVAVAMGALAGAIHIVLAMLAVFIGLTLFGAGKRLASVVSTQGNDIPLLMGALRGYQRVFKIQVILVCIGFVLGVGAALVVAFMA
jgi:hypothetical protein